MTNLGFFILGFLVFFLGGLIYVQKYEMYDLFEEEDDE
tara:strand:- start:617 stop:730 length:114 start_codon:yes stop_codon:yes gene_type:complete